MKGSAAISWLGRFLARPVLVSCTLFFTALALRLLALDRYITPDELIWVYRSVLFREALLARQWADTLVAGHPGVTTTWLGTIALSVQLALQSSDRAAYEWITRLAYLTPDNMAAYRQLAVFLDAGRTVVAIANSLGIVAVFWLTKALFSGRPALIAAILLAIDPFLSGLSGLFHVDALLTTWSILSLLALALGLGLSRKLASARRRALWLLAAGASAALAVLSKSPALLLIPVSGLALLFILLREKTLPMRRRISALLGYGISWLAGFTLILFALHPALWVAPGNVLGNSGSNAGRHIAEALRPTFFLGDVAYDHGPAFYPIVLIWRLSPLVIGGLILLILLALQRETIRTGERDAMLLLVLWAVLFLALISFTAKKFDRYVLPVVPVLAVLAALALARDWWWSSRPLRFLVTLCLAAELLMLVVGLPYQLATYNPLVGGPFTAKMILPLGWGESVSASGRWLAERPRAATESAVSGIAPSLAPFFPGQTQFLETAGGSSADYVILTANGYQESPEAFGEAQDNFELLHTVRYSLLPQAWVFDNPQPQPRELQAPDLDQPLIFKDQMTLIGQDIHANEQEVLFTARWRREGNDPRLLVKLQLVDEAGHVWQELETELLNEVYFYPRDWAVEETPMITYRLQRLPAMPPGSYHVALSLVDQLTAELLPATEGGRSVGVVQDAGVVELDLTGDAIDPDTIAKRPVEHAVWLEGDLRLLGIVEIEPSALAGAYLPLELLWQADRMIPANLQLGLLIGDGDPILLPLTGEMAWPAESLVRQKYRFAIPAELDAGEHDVRLGIFDGQGRLLAAATPELGEVHIDNIDRLFALPDGVQITVDTRYEPGITLRGLTLPVTTAHPGEIIPLTLYWQTEGPTAEPVSAFVHLVSANGGIVTQNDQWPGGLPSDIWQSGQVIVDEHRLTLPLDVQPGEYRLATGLYTASDGMRLTGMSDDGSPLRDDLFWLPVSILVEE